MERVGRWTLCIFAHFHIAASDLASLADAHDDASRLEPRHAEPDALWYPCGSTVVGSAVATIDANDDASTAIVDGSKQLDDDDEYESKSDYSIAADATYATSRSHWRWNASCHASWAVPVAVVANNSYSNSVNWC